MKIPLNPPKFEKFSIEDMVKALRQAQGAISPVTHKGDYLHWDKFRYLETPLKLSHEQWWFITKYARHTLYKQLPFVDKFGKSFVFGMPEPVLKKLFSIDRNTSIRFKDSDSILN